MTPRVETLPERQLRSLAAAAGYRSLRALARAAAIERTTIRAGLRGEQLTAASLAKLAGVLNVPPAVLAMIFEVRT